MDLSFLKYRSVILVSMSVHYERKDYFEAQSEINILFEGINDYLVLDFLHQDKNDPDNSVKNIELYWSPSLQNSKVTSGTFKKLKITDLDMKHTGHITGFTLETCNIKEHSHTSQTLSFHTDKNICLSFSGAGFLPFNVLSIKYGKNPE